MKSNFICNVAKSVRFIHHYTIIHYPLSTVSYTPHFYLLLHSSHLNLPMNILFQLHSMPTIFHIGRSGRGISKSSERYPLSRGLMTRHSLPSSLKFLLIVRIYSSRESAGCFPNRKHVNNPSVRMSRMIYTTQKKLDAYCALSKSLTLETIALYSSF